MTKYTIYTENKNIEGIKKILKTFKIIEGYTLINTTGYYQGQQEKALKIEILFTKHNNWTIKIVCNKIRELNNQEAVLYTVEQIKAEFITEQYWKNYQKSLKE